MSTEKEVVVENPLLQRVRLPGETHKLPSGGIFYTDGELTDDVKNGEIHIYPMTAMDEIVTRTPDKLFSGEAVIEVFKRCVPQVAKPLEIFQKDLDFIMVALRKVSYGPEFEIIHTHNCEQAKEHTYNVNMDKFIKGAKSLNPTSVSSKFQVALENGQSVSIHPIRFKDVISMMQVILTSEDDNSIEVQGNMIDTLISVISSVDDVSDKALIKEWLETIPAGWTHKISGAIDNTTDWGPEFKTKIKCKDCEKMMTVEVPMNPLSFFS